jgi:hypothetical protein
MLVVVWPQQRSKPDRDLERDLKRAWARNPEAPAAGGPWDEPTDFWAHDAEPVDLPPGVVPAIIEGAARDHALRLGVEAGGPAAALITAIGSLVHAGNRLQMRQNDTGWTVCPTLWTSIIAVSGANKSATLGYAIDAARSVDTKLKREYVVARRKYDAQQFVAKRKRKGEPAQQGYEIPAAAGVEFECERPLLRQKIVNNVTTEALAEILSYNTWGVLSYRDELSGFFGAMDAYHQKGGIDRPFWLEAKDGRNYTVNRKTSDPIIVENNAVSVLGGIQPELLGNLSAGLAVDGMLQRFAPVFLRRTGIGVDVAPDKTIEAALAQMAIDLVGANEPTTYRFAPEANDELLAYQAFVARETERPDGLPAFRQWLEKSVNEFGRLSLVFHFLEWYSWELYALIGGLPPELVSAETARRARRYLTEFIYLHAQLFYRGVLGASPVEVHARWIVDFILSRGMSSICPRDIYKNYAPLKKPEKRGELSHTMYHLQMQDWLRPTEWASDGPKKWAINPAVHSRFAERAERERARRESVREKIRRDAARGATGNAEQQHEG